jgi:hypothetical protein
MVGLSEVAVALGKPEAEFRALLPALISLGFPQPDNKNDCIEVADLLSWVVKQQETNLALVGLLAARLQR